VREEEDRLPVGERGMTASAEVRLGRGDLERRVKNLKVWRGKTIGSCR
jgi:hypothetical protein